MSGGVTVSESVLLAENKVLRGKYEDLLRDNETLIQTLEDLEKKQAEAVVVKEEVKHWEVKYGELHKKYGEVKEMLEKLEKAVEYLNSSTDEVCVDSGVIEISSDEEGNQRESIAGGEGGGLSNSQNKKKATFYM